MKHVFNIQGMTCDSCVKTVEEKVSKISGVISTKADLQTKKIEIDSEKGVGLQEVKQALSDLPKYSVQEQGEGIATVEKSWWQTYRPLLLVFTFVFFISLANQIRLGSFHFHLFMNHLMAGFFIGLSFFKFLDLKSFVSSFSSYDPLARWLPGYGWIYPFLELLLGLLFVAGVALKFANILTIFILLITTVGVYRKLQSKSKFQCACLGTVFSLPLSYVTIVENVVMIAMAVYGLVF